VGWVDITTAAARKEKTNLRQIIPSYFGYFARQLTQTLFPVLPLRLSFDSMGKWTKHINSAESSSLGAATATTGYATKTDRIIILCVRRTR
jgi:hypothetical protein